MGKLSFVTFNIITTSASHHFSPWIVENFIELWLNFNILANSITWFWKILSWFQLLISKLRRAKIVIVFQIFSLSIESMLYRFLIYSKPSGVRFNFSLMHSSMSDKEEFQFSIIFLYSCCFSSDKFLYKLKNETFSFQNNQYFKNKITRLSYLQSLRKQLNICQKKLIIY